MKEITTRRNEVRAEPLRMPERLLTTKEVAAYLGVPPRTVEAWRYKGTGPLGIRVGRHVRYRHRDVEAWLLRDMHASSSSQPSGAAKRALAQRETATWSPDERAGKRNWA